VTLRAFVSILLPVSLLACSEPLPEPPDLTETLQAYEEGPTVDVPIQEVADLVVDWLDRTGVADELRGSGIIIEQVVTGVGLGDRPVGDLEPSENVREGIQILDGRFFGDFLVEATHICEGHDPEAIAPDPETNGTLNVNLRLTESGFAGAFWGGFDTCRFRNDDVDLGLEFNTLIADGPAGLLFLDPLGFDVERDYLFTFEGLLIVNDVLVLDGPLDFLFQQDVGTFVRVQDESGGQVLLFQPIDNPTALELRTLSETWQCDLSLQRCSSSDGTQVSW
jgi:hypothetical protein